MRVPPPVVVALCAIAMVTAARLAPTAFVPIPFKQAWCVALVGAGLGVSIAGVLAFRRHKTTVNPLDPGAATTVVRSGVYRISRNPMYLGFLLVLCALAVYLSNALAAASLPAFVAFMNRFQIAAEERALTARFGQEYAAYRASVRRWI